MKKLSTQPYKGTRDFYPAAMRAQNYLFSVMRDVAESFGYQEYAASVLEETDLYRAKTGEEIVNEQTYSFTDRGGRDVTLRPEMTPTVARMIAGAGREVRMPARWYSIPNCFRYERPQRGRLREFWQLNVDLFGASGIEADAEVLQVADALMRAYGADPSTYVIRLNSRRITEELFKVLELDQERAYRLMKLIDRKDKMEAEAFQAEAAGIVGERAGVFAGYLSAATLADLPAELAGTEAVRSLAAITDLLTELGLSNWRFDPALMRGFDYYTGMVFEVFDQSPANARALFGGGRYDGLTDLFGGESVPAVGFGVSDVSMENYLETYGLAPELDAGVDVRVIALPGDVAALRLAARLRGQGMTVDTDLEERSAEKKVRSAKKDAYRAVVIATGGRYALERAGTRKEGLSEEEVVEELS